MYRTHPPTTPSILLLLDVLRHPASAVLVDTQSGLAGTGSAGGQRTQLMRWLVEARGATALMGPSSVDPRSGVVWYMQTLGSPLTPHAGMNPLVRVNTRCTAKFAVCVYLTQSYLASG